MKKYQNKYLPWLITILLIFLGLSTYLEFKKALPDMVQVFGVRTMEWWIAIGCVVLINGTFFLLSLVILWFPKKVKKFIAPIIEIRTKISWMRIPFAIIVAGLPALLVIYTPLGLSYQGLFFRLILFILFSVISSFIMNFDKNSYIKFEILLLGFLLVGSIFIIISQLITITNYPFSITWSEGNRIYDYSLYFGTNRYTTTKEISILRGDPGRYMLWGLPFLIPNSSILIHRLWNVILNTIPYFLFGYILSRWNRNGILVKILFILWTYLFLMQASIYTPLLLSACIIVLFVNPKRLIVSLIAVAIAGFYASSSRWTWLPAPAAWAGIIFISKFSVQEKEKIINVIRRLIPTASVILTGLIAGMLANNTFLSPEEISSTTALSQPLLWYRLLPNTTYPEGILFGLFFATLPLIIFLVYLIASKMWVIKWYPAIIFLSISIGFLAIGLVASVKIGGGNNLHNLDMFFVTLVILTGIAFSVINKYSLLLHSRIFSILLLLVIFFPSVNTVRIAKPIHFPDENITEEAIDVINKRVTQSAKRGEILFLSQRQLLTFGYIKNVGLVHEYEKRYLMDMAMAEDQGYLNNFYRDLSNKRFSMIVTDPIFIPEKGSEFVFGDENDAWVKWVAKPLLCYYAPTELFKEVGIQLLLPREEPKNCPDYIIYK